MAAREAGYFSAGFRAFLHHGFRVREARRAPTETIR